MTEKEQICIHELGSRAAAVAHLCLLLSCKEPKMAPEAHYKTLNLLVDARKKLRAALDARYTLEP
jgi:hypothetical protein